MYVITTLLILLVFLLWQVSLLLFFWPALKRVPMEVRTDWQARKVAQQNQKIYFVHYDL